MIKNKIALCLFLLVFSFNLSYPARFCDGTDDIGTIADDSSFSPLIDGFTIMFWVNFDFSVTDGEAQNIYFHYEDSNDYIFFNVYPFYTAGGASNIYFNLSFKGSGSGEEFSGTIDIGINDIRNQWYHFAAVRPENGTDKLHIYINGINYLTGISRIADLSINPAANLEISTDTNSWWLKGTLDDFVVLTREASEADVLSHMIGRWIPDKDTSLCLPLTEGSGSSFDISPYGHICDWVGTLSVEGAPILQTK